LLARLLREFETDYNRFLREGSSSVTERFTQISSYALGKKVRVSNGTDTYVGVTAGIRPEGLLQVQRDDGAIVMVLAGDVTEIR
jgi:BirA family biotin operon repressor/biotin-[acetyl-CoA-carboxylase] ligase